MRFVLLLLAFVVLVPLASAASSIDLLSVSQDEQRLGGIATAQLEVRPGSGAVFIDSFPLTRLDTQISTRFAREYACQLAEEDCSRKDFFYTLRTSSSVIGGPSAGAAITVLTYAELKGLPIDQSAVMTGTVNSGGLVGPVGGIEEKVEAAREAGYERVLVPAFEDPAEVEGIEVIPVVDVEEAIWHFTGSDVRSVPGEIAVPDAYRSQMQEVATFLCERADSLGDSVGNVSSAAQEFLSRSASAAGRTDFYSAASFCFSANLRLQEQYLSSKSQSDLRSISRQLREDIELFDADLSEQDVSSIADLEVMMVVRERLVESFDRLQEVDMDNVSSSTLALSLERFVSARAWSSFFGQVPSRELDVSDRRLQMSCSQKVIEAQERLNYVQFLLDESLVDTQEVVSNALEDQRQEEWALCLFKATKAKAEADSVITAVYSGSNLNQTVTRLRSKAQSVLSSQTARGDFPIISYAYYEYSGSVDDVFSSNLYASYALELANLDIYFPEPARSGLYVDSEKVVVLVAGLVIGLVGGLLAADLYRRRKK